MYILYYTPDAKVDGGERWREAYIMLMHRSLYFNIHGCNN